MNFFGGEFYRLCNELHEAVLELERRRPKSEMITILDLLTRLEEMKAAVGAEIAAGWFIPISQAFYASLVETERLWDSLPPWLPDRIKYLLVARAPWLVRLWAKSYSPNECNE